MAKTLRILDPKRDLTYTLRPNRPMRVGRKASGNHPDIACDDSHISRRHCELRLERGRLRIIDESSYGTYVNDAKVEGQAWADPGDVLVLGESYELHVLGPPKNVQVTQTYDPGAKRQPTRKTGGRDLSGKTITGRYKLLRKLGEGGAGMVYEAYDEQQQESCAVKLLATGASARKVTTERFQREGMVAAMLRKHPGIVGVFDIGTVQETGELYLAMEYVQGTPLDELIHKTGGLPQRKAVHLELQLCRAVAYAHDHDVIHRDLKPANVIVTAKGEARITDFGLARALDDSFRLTQTGVALGSPFYMAPEQVRDAKRAGKPADVYALGGILYAMLTGRTPFSGSNAMEVFSKILDGDLIPPRRLNPKIDRQLADICRGALAFDPDDRPASASGLADTLESWASQRR